MEAKAGGHVYGPVPSRRLGRSLGVDLVAFKTCTYDCIYCQLGRTPQTTLARRRAAPRQAIMGELKAKLATGERPDWISLAGSGEPTLELDLGEIIRDIKGLTDIPLAVLTNGSLLWQPKVREALSAADLVLPSLDAGDYASFRRINRPHPGISYARMVEGLAEFTRHFSGEVWLEVMLLGDLSGGTEEAGKIADQVRRIAPARVQLNTVCRPPAEAEAKTLAEAEMQALAGLFPGRVEIIASGRETAGAAQAPSEVQDEDILDLLGRRPCTTADVAAGLGIHLNQAIKHLEILAAAGKVGTILTAGRIYHVPAWR